MRRFAVVLATTALLLGGLGGTALAESPAPQHGYPDCGLDVVVAVLLHLGHHH